MIRFPACLAALAFAAPVHAQVMILLATNSAGRELHVDRSSLKVVPPVPDVRRFAVSELLVEIRSPGGRRSGMVTERVRYHFNCTALTVNTVSYYRGAANGSRSHDWRGADWAERYEAVKPGSLIEQAMAYACSGGQLPAASQPPVEQKPEAAEGE